MKNRAHQRGPPDRRQQAWTMRAGTPIYFNISDLSYTFTYLYYWSLFLLKLLIKFCKLCRVCSVRMFGCQSSYNEPWPPRLRLPEKPELRSALRQMILTICLLSCPYTVVEIKVSGNVLREWGRGSSLRCLVQNPNVSNSFPLSQLTALASPTSFPWLCGGRVLDFVLRFLCLSYLNV